MNANANTGTKGNRVYGVIPHYEHEPLTLNGIRLSDFCIVYPEDADQFQKNVAEALSARIADLCGDRLTYLPSNAQECAYKIIIGGKGKALLTWVDPTLCLRADTAHALGEAMLLLIRMVENAVIEGHGKLSVQENDEIPVRKGISVMAYNFYGFHGYQERIDNICRIITKYLPDVLSVQEPDLAMMELTRVNLDAYYDYYNGTPRHGADESNIPEDAKGANSVAPILYNAARFQLISADTKWMSDTPDVPSKFPESKYYRHFTYVELEDRVTKQRFVTVNLHLQRVSAVGQVRVVFEHLNRLFPDVPVFLAGDFNSEDDKPVLYQMQEIAGFASAHNTAKRVRDGHNRIDWIMYTKDCVQADFYHCCTEIYPDPVNKKGLYDGKTPSDHFAFYAELSFDPNAKPHHDWKAASEWEEPAPAEA